MLANVKIRIDDDSEEIVYVKTHASVLGLYLDHRPLPICESNEIL